MDNKNQEQTEIVELDDSELDTVAGGGTTTSDLICKSCDPVGNCVDA